MFSKRILIKTICFLLVALPLIGPARVYADSGRIEGTVRLSDGDRALPAIQITILETKQTTLTDEQGHYQVNVATPGSYTLQASGDSFKTVKQQVQVTAGVVTLNMQMELSVLGENVIVSASPEVQETFRTYQPTSALSGTELQKNISGTLADTLKEEPGVTSRTFGTEAARPVIRGFDGDRVLVLQDGNRTADLSSQSGDHAVPVDPAGVERIEVIRGPASLLYGSNAIGGVVNAVSSEAGHDEPFDGVVGHVTTEFGSVNKEGAANGHIDWGNGNWILHFGGGDRDSSNYESAEGTVQNSSGRSSNLKAGSDYATDNGSIGFTYQYDNLHYDVPTGGETNLLLKRNNYQFHGSVNQLGPFQRLRVNAGYVDYQHQELDGDVVDTTFFNKIFEYKGLLDQPKVGRLTGTFGVSGFHRNYNTIGEEVLAPETDQNSIAAFTYEELGWNHFKLQFGGRIDHNTYTPLGLPDRSFTGVSGSVGILKDLGEKNVFAVNYALAYRAPALEELYNHGPHDGTASFEIGDPNLNRELGNTIDVSLRHQSSRFKGELSAFYANLNDFIFLAPTGETDEDEGLPIALYSQSNARFTGYELSVNFGLNQWLWLEAGSDYVNAELTQLHTAAPRIPPFRGRVGVEFLHKGLSVSPEVIFTSDQNRVFGTETPTDGYTLFNLRTAYVWNAGQTTHTVTASLLNGSNEFYRNHLSFIKDLAPEPGRSIKVTYSLAFF